LAASVLFMVVAPMGRDALDCLYYAIVGGEKQEKKSFSRFLSNKTTLEPLDFPRVPRPRRQTEAGRSGDRSRS
jgi:hypothetical protein